MAHVYVPNLARSFYGDSGGEASLGVEIYHSRSDIESGQIPGRPETCGTAFMTWYSKPMPTIRSTRRYGQEKVPC